MTITVVNRCAQEKIVTVKNQTVENFYLDYTKTTGSSVFLANVNTL